MTAPDPRRMDVEPWTRKGATLSDKTARNELGLTQEEIVQAIRKGKLQYRMGSVYGNPYLRLLRREVENLVRKTHGADHLRREQAKTELSRVERELKVHKRQVAALEAQRTKLRSDLGGWPQQGLAPRRQVAGDCHP